MKKPTPTYYAILDADVRYDAELSANAKLLYAEITALSNKTGQCWANNKYFAELYSVHAQTISTWITQLELRGYIAVWVEKEQGNQRIIQIHPKSQTQTPMSENAQTPMSENAQHNNTSINTTSKKSSDSQSSQNVQKVHRLYLKQFIIPTRLKDKLENTPPEKLMEMAEARYKLSPLRREFIQRRLKDAGLNMLCAAIVGYSREPWYIGENDRGWIANLEEYICRSFEKVEKGAALYEQQRQGKNTNDPWANL